MPSGRKFPQKPIIRTKRLGGTASGSNSSGGRIIDARNKIIQKNRLKIRDARDKLVSLAKRSGDARLKIMRKMHTKQRSHQNSTGSTNSAASRSYMGIQLKKSRLPNYSIDRRRPPAAYGNAPTNHMEIDADYVPAAISLRRTVQNDIAYSKMPPLPSFPRTISSNPAPAGYRIRRGTTSPPHSQTPTNLWNSDPFDCYEVPIGRPADVSQHRNINSEMMPRKGILR